VSRPQEGGTPTRNVKSHPSPIQPSGCQPQCRKNLLEGEDIDKSFGGKSQSVDVGEMPLGGSV
jgi:hypothetical protein